MKHATTQKLNRLLSTYSIPFEVKKGYIDMRTMAENYADGVIPFKDISDILDVMYGAGVTPGSVDTSKGFTDANTKMELKWIPPEDFGILPKIQRDMIPDHYWSIVQDFDPHNISVILAIKDPVTGLTCPYDTHHTSRVLYYKGWSHLPTMVLSLTDDALADYETLDKARADLQLIAGRAFLNINLTHKKPVSGYDKFVIMRDYGEPDALEIENTLVANNAKAVRIAKNAGEISHYPNLWKAFELQDSHFTSGRYLDMALKFHQMTWPAEQVYGATLIGLAIFFHKCERAKVKLDKTFMDDLSTALKKSYRLSKFTHEGYKEEFEKANPYGSASDDLKVASGLVHTYNKHVGKQPLYTPELQFSVK